MIFWNRKEYTKEDPFFEKKDCPFCNYEKEEKKLILHKTKYWEIRYNKFPYYWDKLNLLVFPIKHKELTSDLTENELKDYINVEKWMQNYFKDQFYCSFIRQWLWKNWWKWGKSVAHLHYHYLAWIMSHNSEWNWQSFNIIYP